MASQKHMPEQQRNEAENRRNLQGNPPQGGQQSGQTDHIKNSQNNQQERSHSAPRSGGGPEANTASGKSTGGDDPAAETE